MDPSTLKQSDRISHSDFGEGAINYVCFDEVCIDWDRQGCDSWEPGDHRWEQVELA